MKAFARYRGELLFKKAEVNVNPTTLRINHRSRDIVFHKESHDTFSISFSVPFSVFVRFVTRRDYEAALRSLHLFSLEYKLHSSNL